MKLERLALANYRGFDQIELDFEKDITVIAGVNGVGKSALLGSLVKAMSLALPRITPSGETVLGMADTDVKSGKENLTLSVALSYRDTNIYIDIARAAPINLEIAAALAKRRDELRFATRETKKGSKAEGEIADELHRLEIKLAPVKDISTVRILPKGSETDQEALVAVLKTERSQPIAVFYSTSRFFSRLPSRLSKTKAVEIATAYEKALNQLKVSLNDFANWYRVLIEGSKPKIAKRMFSQLEAAISTFLPDMGELNLHTEGLPRFSVKKNGSTFYLEQLSDGERGLLALVFDLTRRLAIANPDSNNPIVEGVALVLIDEIELHLHPKWQRDVLGRLRGIFKNCQFVVTTHSPLVLGEVEARCVRFLEFQEGKVVATTPTEAYGMDANRILQELMGAPVRNRAVESDLRDLFELIDQENFEKAHSKIAELKKQLGEHEPELTRASSLITFLEGS